MVTGDMGDLDRTLPGRARQRDKTDVFADESQTLNEIAMQAERALAARRQARYEARNIRMRELEKKAREEVEGGGGPATSPHPATSPNTSLHHNNSLNHSNSHSTPHTDGVSRRADRSTRSYNSRRSSTDSSEDGFNQNVRDLKTELKEVEEKFRKAMVANASLDNEKCQLMFQVDLLKDQVEEGEEQAALVSKELRAKTHDYELLKRDHAESVRAVQLLQTALASQQAMLQERGLVLCGAEEGVEEGEALDEQEQEKRTRAIVSQETANILSGLGSGPLDVRIKRLAGQRDDLQDTVRRLKLDLEEERSRSSLARGAASQEELERETKKLLDDYKFKISKSEQEIATLAANVARLESQVIRFKTAAETAEQSEESLKTERRKMQRELRDAITRNEELETQNKYLEARLDKLKTAKSNLLKDL